MLPTLQSERFAAIITDPPYGVSEVDDEPQRVGSVAVQAGFGPWDTLTFEKAAQLIAPCAAQFFRVLRPGGAVYVFTGDIFWAAWEGALRREGFELPRPHLLAWVKTNPPPSVRKHGWRSAMEPILYARKPGRDVFNWLGDAQMRSALEFPLVGGERLHPTQKPVALLERLLLVSTEPGDEVLDPFAGSGSTGEAALRNGRKALLIEKDVTFHGLATERIHKTVADIKRAGAK
jgi:DNA modification methylase